MASAVIPPRQLAPTVGPAVMLAGIHIRTGNYLSNGERVVTGLMQRFGNLSFFADNAGCLAGGPLPLNGCVILFGDIEVYVATTRHRPYPDIVHVAADPPAHLAARGRHAGHPTSSEVMCLAPTATGMGDAGGDVGSEETLRRSEPTYEKPENRASTSRAKAMPSPLDATIEKLAMPADPGADPEPA